MDTVLEALRPIGKSMIIDCVRDAGIDVRAWGFRKKDGHPVALPQSNGGYCYEWSFRGLDGAVSLLCVWFEELDVDSKGRVCFAGNLKAYADTLIRRLEKDPKNRNRTIKDPRISRAQYFSSTLHIAYLNSKPLRVVLVSGPVRELDDTESGSDRAVGRYLDEESWRVESFDDDTGAFILVRGDHQVKIPECGSESVGLFRGPVEIGGVAVGDEVPVGGKVVVDQFLAEGRPVSYSYKGEQKYRDPRVRAIVLARSGGICELTSVPGFQMVNGGVYLETHHIVPLSEGGPDTVENVIALSADAHRRAHYGDDRIQLRQLCSEIVASHMYK